MKIKVKKIHLIKSRNSHAILIPRAYLKALGIHGEKAFKETQFEIMTDGVSILIKPVKPIKEKRKTGFDG